MPHTLIITLEDDGQLKVAGPTGHKVLCYGMLELAKDAIQAQPPAKGPTIDVVRGALPSPGNGAK